MSSLSATPIPPPRTGPLRSGNPRGNPNLAPRCGANTRAGCPCRSPAMSNGRCRMHGGQSTGPRTAAGLARLAASHTTHGRFSTAARADTRHAGVMVGRARVLVQAAGLRRWLAPDLAARLVQGPRELMAPPDRRTLLRWTDKTPCTVARDARGRFVPRAAATRRGRAAERLAARQEAASLAPWKAAIAAARLARRQADGAPPPEWRQDPLHRGDGTAAGGMRARAAGAQGAGPVRENSGQDPMHRGDGSGRPDESLTPRAPGHRDPAPPSGIASDAPALRAKRIDASAPPPMPKPGRRSPCLGASGVDRPSDLPARPIADRGRKDPMHRGDGAAARVVAALCGPGPSPSALRASTSPASAGEVNLGTLRRTVLASTQMETLAGMAIQGGGWLVVGAAMDAFDNGRDWLRAAQDAARRAPRQNL